MGGHEAARIIWREYGVQADAIIFMVDAAARDRFEEARIVLHNLLKDDAMAEKPLVVLGNKIDKGDAASEEELRQCLALPATVGKNANGDNLVENQRAFEIFMCSVVKETGYGDAFRWVARFLR